MKDFKVLNFSKGLVGGLAAGASSAAHMLRGAANTVSGDTDQGKVSAQ